MNTLSDHTILYDADCPLCRAYTGAFVRNGLLDTEGRHPFQQLPDAWEELIDTEKAQSEIALLDKRQGRVYYGIDAMFRILGHALPLLKPLFRWQPFRRTMRDLYFFISYNRKVIAPVRPGAAHGRECLPAFSGKYRLAYLVFAWLVTSLVLHRYAPLMSGLVPAGTFYRELLVCGGQVVFQGGLLWLIARAKGMDYLGNMMTVSLMGALALLPALLVGSFLADPPAPFFVAYFLVTAGLMLLEHGRRMKLLGLGLLPSVGWVVYRLLVLLVLLNA